ncbi:MAG: ComEA family DNA-binding protein [Actinomycetota bacterium]
MGESFRDRLSSLSRGELTGLVAIVALTLAGAGFWYVRSLPQRVAIRAESSPLSSPASPSPPPLLVVDVAGWVRRPGVYELSEGDRVIDALESAGGARKGAMLTGLNLAAPVTDGEQVLVPEPIPKRLSDEELSASEGDSSETDKVNVNSADATELESLSGIGEVLAERIIDFREENGPFESVDELEDVSGIGPATLEEMRNDVTV